MKVAIDPKSTAKPAQILSQAAMKYIEARQSSTSRSIGGHCQGGGSW